MASIVRRRTTSGDYRYRAKVTRVGFKQVVKTFGSIGDARKWARKLERQIDIGDLNDYSEASKLLLADILKRYLAEGRHTDKKDQQNIRTRIGNILSDSIADLNLLRLSTKHVAEFRDRSLKKWSPNTFNNHKSLLSVIIDTAITEWGIYMPINPCRSIKRVPIPEPRDRVLVGDEYQRLMKACSESKHPHLKSAVSFSLETACRQGEMLKAERKHVNWKRRTLWFYDTKNGSDRKTALSEKAFSILSSLPEREDGKLFPFKNRDELNWYWLKALKDARIKDFVYHDLRRSACTFMFEHKNLSVPQVQLMSGHRDPRVLLRIYTNLNPEKLVAQLG